MRVRFTARAVYETAGRGKGPVFEAGSEHEFRDDIARRWIRRGVAVEAAPVPAVKRAPRRGRKAAQKGDAGA